MRLLKALHQHEWEKTVDAFHSLVNEKISSTKLCALTSEVWHETAEWTKREITYGLQ